MPFNNELKPSPSLELHELVFSSVSMKYNVWIAQILGNVNATFPVATAADSCVDQYMQVAHVQRARSLICKWASAAAQLLRERRQPQLQLQEIYEWLEPAWL